MAENNIQNLIEENKRLKLEVETYLRGYENILADKILLEEEFKSYKLAKEEQKKELIYFNPGKTQFLTLKWITLNINPKSMNI